MTSVLRYGGPSQRGSRVSTNFFHKGQQKTFAGGTDRVLLFAVCRGKEGVKGGKTGAGSGQGTLRKFFVRYMSKSGPATWPAWGHFSPMSLWGTHFGPSFHNPFPTWYVFQDAGSTEMNFLWTRKYLCASVRVLGSG